MSNRAEGCGQWLSTKTKRATTQLAPIRTEKAKKKKGLLNFARKLPTSGLNVHVSCSPLSPRTRKKLKTAKQSKIDTFFKARALPNGSANNDKAKSKNETLLADKRIKVPVKRHRDEDSSSGYSTEDMQSNEHLYSQGEEINDSTDLNISGISFLDDSYQGCQEFIENDLQQESEIDKNRDSLTTSTLSPPNKKLRTSESASILTGDERRERNKLRTILENDPSQSFHFSQWKRDQIAKCKEIEGGNLTEDSPCVDASCLIGDEEESDLALNEGTVGRAFSETPPFQFTQWAKQQVQVCRKIEKETDIADIVLQRSLKSVEQNNRHKATSRERKREPEFTNHSDSPFDFTEWAENQVQLCRNFSDTNHTGSIDWETEKWGEWMYKTENTDPVSLLSNQKKIQFSK